MNAHKRIAGAAVVAAALLVLGSCGGSGSGVSSTAGAQLEFRVAAIRAAAARGDRGAADDQLAHLRVDVVQFRATNKIDDAAATRILRAAGVVESELSLLAPASTTTASTTTTTQPPHKGKGHDKGPGKHGDNGD